MRDKYGDDYIISRQNDYLISSSTPTQTTSLNIPWTIADLFAEPPALAVFYHSIGTPYDILTPTGAIFGAFAHPLVFSSSPFWEVVANGGLTVGFTVMASGAIACARVALKGEQASPPWDAQGIADRKLRLKANHSIRALDAGVWTGTFAGAALAAIVGGPAQLGLSDGTIGVLQALCLGSIAGSILTMGTILTKRSNAN